MASFTAAGTAYATWGQPMIPFFIFYSMFGFQRVGDLIWAFGDQRGRGFLLGATAGRTTLAGEGLQHCDGQSQLLASTRTRTAGSTTPRSPTRWPSSSRDGIERMYGAEARGLLLLPHPLQRELPDAGDARRRRGRASCAGLYRYRRGRRATAARNRAQILASGTAMLAALDAQQMLAERLRRRRRRVERDQLQDAARGRAVSAERWNRLHPTEPAAHAVRHRRARGDGEGPIVAVTDFMKAVPDQIARFVPGAVHRRSGPTATASPTPGRAAPPLRGRRADIVVAVLQGLAADRRDQGRGGRRGDRPLRHRPRPRRPPPHLTLSEHALEVASATPTRACSVA